MAKRLVFLYDSTLEPWHGDIGTIQRRLAALPIKDARVELMDTRDMPGDELERWRDEAVVTSVRHHQQIRQAFGSRHQGGLPDFGKRVPALPVYEKGGRIPVAVYPHGEKRGGKHSDFSIEGFLEQLETRS
jgi:hypothetical protein